MVRIASAARYVPEVMKWSRALSRTGARRILSDVTPRLSGSSSDSDAIVGYRTFVAVIAAAYFTLVSLAYLLIEFAIGMRINALAWEGSLPLILLPLAAQAVILLPRVLAAGMCVLVIAGVSGTLSWVPAWPHWLRNIAQATAAVVFVVVYV